MHSEVEWVVLVRRLGGACRSLFFVFCSSSRLGEFCRLHPQNTLTPASAFTHAFRQSRLAFRPFAGSLDMLRTSGGCSGCVYTVPAL